MKIETKSANAPAAIGPYSQAISFGGFTFISGQLPIEPATGVIPDGIAAQTRISLNNVQAILKEAGMEMKDVLKTTVYLSSIGDFQAMNEVYAEYFPAPYPARAAFEVSCLPKQALVEIEVVAAK